MTCIAAVSDGRKVWMGGDSLATYPNFDKVTLSMPKVWVVGDFIFGVAGMAAMLQGLSMKFVPSVYEFTDDFIYRDLTTQLKQFLVSEGLGDETHFHGQVLVGFNGSIYDIGGDYFTVKSREPYSAIGSGAPFALGSLAGSVGSPHKRVVRALQAAVEHNAACGEPFTVLSGGRKQ